MGAVVAREKNRTVHRVQGVNAGSTETLISGSRSAESSKFGWSNFEIQSLDRTKIWLVTVLVPRVWWNWTPATESSSLRANPIVKLLSKCDSKVKLTAANLCQSSQFESPPKWLGF